MEIRSTYSKTHEIVLDNTTQILTMLMRNGECIAFSIYSRGESLLVLAREDYAQAGKFKGAWKDHQVLHPRLFQQRLRAAVRHTALA